MNYELAKKLKDAGFPQKNQEREKEHEWVCQHAPGGHIVTAECDRCYQPTLSELIEACGEDFWELQRLTVPPYPRWYAEAHFPYLTNDGIESVCVDGLTAEEAVAKLWLALKKTKR